MRMPLGGKCKRRCGAPEDLLLGNLRWRFSTGDLPMENFHEQYTAVAKESKATNFANIESDRIVAVTCL